MEMLLRRIPGRYAMFTRPYSHHLVGNLLLPPSAHGTIEALEA